MEDSLEITNPGFISLPSLKDRKPRSKKVSINQSVDNNINLEQSTLPDQSEANYLVEEIQENLDPIAQKRKERQWEQTMSKISFAPSDDNFYSYNEYYVRPGFGLFTALASARSGFRQLEINIPETLMVFEVDTYMFYTDQTGHLIRQPDTKWAQFEQRCAFEHKQLCLRFKKEANNISNEHKGNERKSVAELCEKLNPIKNPDCPLMIQRSCSAFDWKLNQNVLRQKEMDEKFSTDASSTLLEQRFIISKSLKASVVRYAYNAKSQKDIPATFAYKLINNVEIFDPHPKKSITLKATLNQDRQFSYQVQKVNASGIKEYEKQTRSLVQFLEKNNPIRIQQIVLDFMHDIEGKVWLIGMQSIRANNTITLGKIVSNDYSNIMKNNQTFQLDKTPNRSLEEIIGTVSCKLCGVLFQKNPSSKILTYKLLWEFLQHLKKRNITLNKINLFQKSSEPCSVCGLCYMLVVGEHELIQIEKKFAKAQNIPIQIQEQRSPFDVVSKQRPALLKDHLNQWRLIYFISEISNIELDQDINFSNLYLHYKLEKKYVSFQVESVETIERTDREEIDQWTRFRQLNVNQIRVHYFFSEGLDIEQFINKTECKFRLTEGPDWDSVVAEGSSKNIAHFKNKEKGGQLHSAQIYLFFKNAKYCTLKLRTGLVCDGEYNAGNLNLVKHKDIYFPDENYFNSNEFPDEWMEMFDPQFYSKRQDLREKNVEKYAPKCTSKELNKMINLKKNQSYKHIKSRVFENNKSEGHMNNKGNFTSKSFVKTPNSSSSNNYFIESFHSSKPNLYQESDKSAPNSQKFQFSGQQSLSGNQSSGKQSSKSSTKKKVQLNLASLPASPKYNNLANQNRSEDLYDF